jgi:hypothetical protein
MNSDNLGAIAPGLGATLSRRQFLRRTALAAALAAGPTVVPGSVFSQGNSAPNSRINMGFIGLGGQGSGHLLGGAWTYVPGGYVARNDVQVLAVCDVRQERRENAQQRCNQLYAQRYGQTAYRGVQTYNDFRQVLARPDIDAVLIAVPYHWAAPMSIMAMRAGKDVYCEKPIAITIREGEALTETCRRFSRIYQAGTQQRSEYGGKFRIACEWVRNQRLGQLKEVFAFGSPGVFYPDRWTSDNSQPVPAGFDWDLWLGPLPWRPYSGEAGHALSGCFVGDVNWAPHRYDIVMWTVNPDPADPVEIELVPGGVDYHFLNGVVVHSRDYPGGGVGGNGGACFVGTQGRIAVDRDSIVSDPPSILKQPLRPSDARVEHATSHSGNFLDCVRTRRPAICHPETAVRTMDIILVGGIALALNRSLKWDPAKHEFPGDAQANRLLSYATRPPWRI